MQTHTSVEGVEFDAIAGQLDQFSTGLNSESFLIH